MNDLSAPVPGGPTSCPGCSAALEPGAAFCASCGRSLAGAPAQRPAFFESHIQRDRDRRMKRASKWLLILSIAFVVFGTGYGLYNQSQAREAQSTLARMSDTDVIPIEGKSYTVAELKTKIDREVILLFAVNYFLAVVMLGLFLWSRRAPFPAMVTGLCVYLAVIALDAALDPKTLVQGILIKILFISALVAGIKAALEERDSRTPAG